MLCVYYLVSFGCRFWDQFAIVCLQAHTHRRSLRLFYLISTLLSARARDIFCMSEWVSVWAAALERNCLFCFARTATTKNIHTLYFWISYSALARANIPRFYSTDAATLTKPNRCFCNKTHECESQVKLLIRFCQSFLKPHTFLTHEHWYSFWCATVRQNINHNQCAIKF